VALVVKENYNSRDLIWLVALVLVGLGARLWLIQAFGTPLPFWDQWEDTRTVFSPYFEGKLTLAALFSPHNENRIFLTRVYDLALLLLNGQWDNLVQMVANVFFYVGTLAGFAWLLALVLGRRFWPLLALLFMIVLAMPFTWENSLYGYDSQFYFIVFFSLLTFWLLGFHKPGSLAWCVGVVAAVCSLFAMAAGMLAAAAVFGLVLLRLIVKKWSRSPLKSVAVPHESGEEMDERASSLQLSPARDERGNTTPRARNSTIPTLIVCLVVILLGLVIKVEVPFHQVLKAHSFMQFLVFLGKCLAWPWIVLPQFAIFNLFPVMLLAWVYWRHGEARTAAEELVLTLGLWGVLQALATAYARGGYMYPQWRYMDGICFIMIANALSLALLATHHKERVPFGRYFQPCAALWILACISGLVLLCGRAWQVDIPLRAMHQTQQILTMRAYTATGDRKYLKTREKEYLARFAPPNEPQDHPKALIDMLNLPHIREIMPACARDPLPVRPASVSGFFTNVDVPAKPVVPGEIAWSSYSTSTNSSSGAGATAKGRFESQPVRQSKLPFLEFRVAGDLGRPGLFLRLTELKSGKTTEIKPRTPPGGGWQSYQVKAPAGDFKITAGDASSDGWFAFQPPREVGWLSWLSAHFMALGKWVFFAGVAVYFGAFACLRRKSQQTVAASTGDGKRGERGT
jgi:hypothetical protein